jgi:hypothetical protein
MFAAHHFPFPSMDIYQRIINDRVVVEPKRAVTQPPRIVKLHESLPPEASLKMALKSPFRDARSGLGVVGCLLAKRTEITRTSNSIENPGIQKYI